jgi:hypothetical protein
MLRTRVVLAGGFAVLIAALLATLSGSPSVVARSNSVATTEGFESVSEGLYKGCQRDETLPRGTTAIRLSLDSVLGPRVALRVLSGKRVLTSGQRGSGWTAADVTVPVKPLAETVAGVKVCFEFTAKDESVVLAGERVGGASSGRAEGAVKVEYLVPGGHSWWSLAAAVAGNIGRGRAWSGGWVAPFLAAAMAAVAAIVGWLALRLAR